MRHLALFVILLAGSAPTQERPWSRPVVASKTVASFAFANGPAGWHAQHAVTLRVEHDRLIAEATGDDPYFISPPLDLTGNLRVTVTGDFAIAGAVTCYWTTATAPAMSEERVAHGKSVAGKGSVDLQLGEVQNLRHLRLDPGGNVGTLAIESIVVTEDRLAECWVTGVRLLDDGRLQVDVEPGEHLMLPVEFENGFAEVELELPTGIAASRSAVHLHDLAVHEARAPDQRTPNVLVYPECSAAAVYRKGELVAVVHPLVLRDGRAVPLQGTPDERGRWDLTGEGVRVSARARGWAVEFAIDATTEVEGPVIRSAGPHVRAMFAGLEYLSRGEPSSSDADIETAARFRFAPDPLFVTWPCAVVQTERATITLSWEDAGLQPVFSAPDRYDGMPCTRNALRGTRIRAKLECWHDSAYLGMLRMFDSMGLPDPLPGPPDREAWLALCRAAYDGPLAGDGGWGHCAEERWARAPSADHVSALWRLDGTLPELVLRDGVQLVPGGAHLHDDASWFVAGQAGRWTERMRKRAEAIAKSVRKDGTVAYAGKYLRGHFEDTSSGQCGLAATTLLEFARISGDEQALATGLRVLEACQRFQVPRGAQVWELSLHTPDILAAAYLVRAHVLAFELTGYRSWLAHACGWAMRGLPFVYLRDDAPAMPYATIAVFGATNWRAPLWLGLPVQWCGLVYADALARLAEYDDSFAWRRVAEGILRAGQHMQYPDGPVVGCLPDLYDLRTARGAGPSINPGALLALDARLRGEPVDLHVLELSNGRRAVSAWPLREEDGRLFVQTERPTAQVVLDGREVVEVPAAGLAVPR